jgi:excisionase family DNA binding protein
MGNETRALSVEEAAKAAGVGRTLLYEHIRGGRLTARKAGRRTIITVDELDAWLRTLPTSADLRSAGVTMLSRKSSRKNENANDRSNR